jgi:hypothetical protein
MNKLEKKAKNLINKLLEVDRCNENIGTWVNELVSLTWENNFQFSIIKYYYDKSNNYGHYRDIAFILSESKYYRNKEAIPIMKKLIALYDIRIISDLLVGYLLAVDTSTDIKVYLALLKKDNCILYAFYALRYLEKETIQKLSFLSCGNEYFNILLKDKKTIIVLTNKLEFNKKSELSYMAYLVALLRHDIDKNFIRNFVLKSKSLNIYNFYYDFCCQ